MFKIKIPKEDFQKYPLLIPLLHIPDPPKFLNLRAKEENLLQNFLDKKFQDQDYKILTIVGSRKNSNYAKEALEYLLKYLRTEKIMIVSGLALGIDSWAHKLALENDFPTISVPGSGLGEKNIYPASNLSLAQEILESGNLLLSEFEDEAKSQLYFFPARNRIMAAISDAILIVEAGEKSGTLITARLGVEYGKNVGVIPNSIFAGNASGSNQLIHSGATPVLGPEDILEMLKISKPNQNLLNFDNQEDEQLKKQIEALGEDEKNILQRVLREGSLEKDTLFSLLEKESTLTYTDFLVALMNLEIKGFLKEELGEIRLIK